MRTGTIVYLAGAGAVPAELDLSQTLKREGLDPRWTEVAGSAPGFYRPEEALLVLTQRGAGRVDLVRARFDSQQGLHVGADRTRLAG